MTVAYTDIFAYRDSPEGLDTASLVGNAARLNAAVTLGATTLTVTPATTVDLQQFDKITIYDGLNSEVVQVASTTLAPATSIPLLTGTQFAHVQYTPLSSKGVFGDIGGEILKASGWVENITRQALFLQTYTETLRMPTMRASIDNQQILVFRPNHYPIATLTALSIAINTSNSTPYDPAQAIIDANELITVPQLISTGSGSSTYSILPPQVSRQQNAYLTFTYTAGFAATALPGDIKDAATLLTSELLSRKYNPTGADALNQGKRHSVNALRGDLEGDSLLIKRAKYLLSNYTLRAF